jgi:2-oxoglutarate dehydrogenase E2 component (dihydrolipoamide succinyltransferase)
VIDEVIAVRAPVENVNDDTIAIVSWLVENGTHVEKGQPLVLAETSKTSFDVPAPGAGFMWQVAPAETDVPIGTVLCYLGDTLEKVKAAAASASQPQPDSAGPAPVADQTLPAAPAEATAQKPPARFSATAAALLREFGIDPAVFAGRGLIREQDVRGYQASVFALQTPTPVSPAAPQGVRVRVEKQARSKKVEVRHLRAGWTSTLPSSVSVAVPTSGFFSDVTGRAVPGFASAAIIYETARLLRQYPIFNACYADEETRYYESVNLGYAIDLGKGLKVPVIQNADRKSLHEIAEEKQRYLVDYLADALPLESLVGGTFTLTDLSGEGVVHFQPMINEGQSAILGVLGVCAEVFPPGAAKGSYNLVLAFDHQLADGRTAACFLRDLRERLIAHEAGLFKQLEQREPAEEPCCSICLRPVGELEDTQHFLLRTVTRVGDGGRMICSICLSGW